MDSLNRTFATYTGKDIGKACTDCGDTDDLMPLGSTFGHQVWICQDCKVKSARELQARIDAAMNDVATHVTMDEWEEA